MFKRAVRSLDFDLSRVPAPVIRVRFERGGTSASSQPACIYVSDTFYRAWKRLTGSRKATHRLNTFHVIRHEIGHHVGFWLLGRSPGPPTYKKPRELLMDFYCPTKKHGWLDGSSYYNLIGEQFAEDFACVYSKRPVRRGPFRHKKPLEEVKAKFEEVLWAGV